VLPSPEAEDLGLTQITLLKQAVVSASD
jgi:hypothetical protein